jgi:hypothetical protein
MCCILMSLEDLYNENPKVDTSDVNEGSAHVRTEMTFHLYFLGGPL